MNEKKKTFDRFGDPPFEIRNNNFYLFHQIDSTQASIRVSPHRNTIITKYLPEFKRDLIRLSLNLNILFESRIQTKYLGKLCNLPKYFVQNTDFIKYT